jgi:hypothetical protein
MPMRWCHLDSRTAMKSLWRMSSHDLMRNAIMPLFLPLLPGSNQSSHWSSTLRCSVMSNVSPLNLVAASPCRPLPTLLQGAVVRGATSVVVTAVLMVVVMGHFRLRLMAATTTMLGMAQAPPLIRLAGRTIPVVKFATRSVIPQRIAGISSMRNLSWTTVWPT